ncbi:MAG TPA: MgtC/SapB family protein [Ktedonobacterales bacterium]|nr:MgtC/SapB family protein [Ktedonobacterales bacterium]
MVALPLGEALLRLGVALLLGLLVGIERERKNTHPAGMRTLALVSMGSALFTILSAHGFAALTGPGYAPVDPTRIAAQIVSGIGFIGAGTILLQRNAVRGLTTAAAIWMMAAVGMACGVGLLADAVAATLFALIVLAVLQPIERRLFHRRTGVQRIRLSVGAEAGDNVLHAVHTACVEAGVPVESLSVRTSQNGDEIEVRCRARAQTDLLRLTSALRRLPGVQAVHAQLDGE